MHRARNALVRSEFGRLPRLSLLALALLLVLPAIPAIGGDAAAVEPAPTCSAGTLLPGQEQLREFYPLIDPSIPGWWRQEMRFQEPFRREPGTLAILPQSPAPAEATTDGRWVKGYRPATPQAQAELDAWKAGQNSVLAGIEGADTPRSTSNFATNLLNGERVERVPDEEITHTVHAERHDISTFDLRDVDVVKEEQPRVKGPASEIHHGSSLTWNEYLLIKEMARTSPTTPDAQQAPIVEAGRAPGGAGVGFDAIQSNITSVPPDAIMAAGPSHLVAVVNTRYQVYDKSGAALIDDIPLNTFFDGVSNCDGVFDVFVDYDEALDRFVMGGMALYNNTGVDSYICIAATATGDPTGAWHRTSFRADGNAVGTWIDFPHMGIGLDAIYIAGNMFIDGGGLDHVRAFAVEKDALYAGTPMTVAEANLSSLFFTAQPVKLHGFTSGGWPAPGTPHHFIAHDGGGNSRIWRWSDPLNLAPVIYGTIAEENFGGIPPNAPELNGGDNDSGSAKWLDAEYRGGKLWATRNVACDFDGGSSESCIDWVQVDVSGSSPVLEQQQSGGAYGSANDFRYYPDLSVDRNYNVAIGYTKSSASTYTEVWVTGRESDDAAGTLQAETLQRAGLGGYSDNSGCLGNCDRWGDYTGMTVDPDGCTFWYLGQFSDGGYFNWATHIGSFRFSSCSVDSSLQVDKGSVTCNDTLTVTVTDSTPIDAATVAAQTTLSTGSDSEAIPAGSWVGSDCAGSDCGSWTTSLPVSGDPGSNDDGTINVNDGETIVVDYLDPHAGHDDQARNVAVTCSTRLEDGGYIIDGGCEMGQGAEAFRDYMDGGEYIAYTFGIFNPATGLDLTDIQATLSISGPAASMVTIFNPTVHIGELNRDTLTAPVFSLYLDPSIDADGFRMSDHDFNLSVTSSADGFTASQMLTQSHMLQTDDNIVDQAQCWNFEAGDQGFVSEPYADNYNCGPISGGGCPAEVQVNTVAAPWTHGGGCGSETRDDYPEMTCDVNGVNAFMSNVDGASCNNFETTASTITDDVLYSSIFAPVDTGNAANGQPWYFYWQYAEWFYRSDMYLGEEAAMATGFFFDNDYSGIADPGYNEIDSQYNFFYGYLAYANQGWDSSLPWDPAAPPANLDGISFGGAGSRLAEVGTQWRWAVEAFDADRGGDPQATGATQGLALDNMNLAYQQYHAEGQIGTCGTAPAVVSLDQFNYLQCPGSSLGVSVLDGGAAGSVRVTLVSAETGDRETFDIYGSGPYFALDFPYSTGDGAQEHDGTLFVLPSDAILALYDDATTGETMGAVSYINCQGGDVVADGVAGLSDNGDGDSYADTNETVDLSIRIRNNTGQDLHNVTAIISSDDPMIDCVTKEMASFGTIVASGGTGTNDLLSDPFTFKVSDKAICADPNTPPTATFQVLIMADDFGGPRSPQQITMVLDMNDLPGTITFNEDFSSEPAGFYHQLGPGDDDGVSTDPGGLACSPYVDEFFWGASGGNPGGGYFLWDDPADSFPDGTYSDLNDAALYSPVLKIGATNTTLSFDHEYQFGWTGEYRVDGVRVDYSVNGGAWQKVTTLPYDGPLIWNTYCNPLCNGTEFGLPCFTEAVESGEEIFNQLNLGTIDWTNVAGGISGLNVGDTVQFRWRFGSMNTNTYGISTAGGYGLDNVNVTSVVEQVCDTATNPDTGCGVLYESSGNLTEICGDGDALVEPTERWAVDVTLRNSSSASSVNATADLATSIGSSLPATVTGNPGSYGTLAAGGGTATTSYEFVVDPAAVCINDITFNLENISDNGATYNDKPAAFTVEVGGIGSQEVATQAVSPITASGSSASSSLTPALITPLPANSATVNYGYVYTNTTPEQVGAQSTDPLVVENTSTTTTLGAPFTMSDATAISAVIDWTSLSHQDVQDCTRVFVRTPSGINFTLKAVGELPAEPYDLLNIYQHANGGTGQYSIGVEEVSSGPCKNEATLTGATMTVTGPTTTGSWTGNVRVALFDGTSEYLLKGYGVVDVAPHDVTSIYNASGPGSYELRIEESGGGGIARVSSGSMTVDGVECDLGCASFVAPAPPLADGYFGSGITLDKGAGANELDLTIDNATCSAVRAVVVYGNIGDYSGYQGAVDTGCDIGSGPTATVTHAGDNVWFNVIWVNEDDAAGHPGFDSWGSRTWDATGFCSVALDDPSDAVCN